MTEIVRLRDVFVPGREPNYTYNPRSDLELEQQLADYVDERGAILTLSGPTKSGKTVLLRRILNNPAWVESQGIESVDVLWDRLADQLRVWPGIGGTRTSGSAGTASVGAEAGIFAAKAKVDAAYSESADITETWSTIRPLGSIVREALLATERPVVIDDFHFVSRPVQREIVRALKPLVLDGVPIILVAISHRFRDVVLAEPDMGGRVRTLEVPLWRPDELMAIARQGFEVMKLVDTNQEIAAHLAGASYGSPHLMQQFCREVCKLAGFREAPEHPHELPVPGDWPAFFSSQVDEASLDWFEKVLRGPQERGSPRAKWPLHDGRLLDGYGLTLAALVHIGVKTAFTKDEIKAAIEQLVDGAGPAAGQTTRVLQVMSRIAATRATEPVPFADELEAEVSEEDVYGLPDIQPVLEYMDEGPNSRLHIADPFFAFCVQWGSDRYLTAPETSQPALPIATDQKALAAPDPIADPEQPSEKDKQ